jgi:hypothetical protein
MRPIPQPIFRFTRRQPSAAGGAQAITYLPIRTRPLSTVRGPALFSGFPQPPARMTFKHFGKWRPRNLELVRSILEDTPGLLPVELEKIDGAAFLSVNRRTERRLETLSVALRRDWLEEPAGIPQLALAVRRFADCASGFEENPAAPTPW